MNKVCAVLAVSVAALAVVSATGCQSGWKFSNPFSRAPKASDAEAPSELDDLAGIDDITSPPENYTVDDSIPKNDKTSLAQKGRYGESEEDAIAASDARLESSPDEDFRAPSYAQNYQTQPATSSYDTSGAQSYASRQPSTGSLADTVANLTPDASVAAASQPYVPQNQPYMSPNTADTSLYDSSNNASFAANTQYPAAPTSNPAPAQYPSVQPGSNGSYPIAQVSSTTQAQQPTQAQPVAEPPTNVAFNYDPSAPANNAPAADSDPYSNVIYTPQNTSGGFAPGSVLY